MTESSTIEIYKTEGSTGKLEIYTSPIEISSQYLSSISNDNRKALRSELFSATEIDFKPYESFKRYKIFEFDIQSNLNDNHRRPTYKGTIHYSADSLNRLNLRKDDKERLESILNPQNSISYIGAEAAFNGSHSLLLASMTILSDEYSRIVEEVDYKHTKDQESTDAYLYKPRFLFTKSEEVIFLTGRTLLKTLNEGLESEYIDSLINDIDGIIIRFNEGLIGKYVQQYSFLADTEELFQQGQLGFIEALRKLDIDKGFRLSTYAGWDVRRAIQKFVEDNSRLIRIPRNKQRKIYEYRAIEAELIENGLENPTFEEITKEGERQGVNLGRLDYLKKALTVRYIKSLDKEISNSNSSSDPFTLHHILSKKEGIKEERELFENREYLNAVIANSGLTKRELHILKLNYGLITHTDTINREYSYKEIASMYGLSRERVRQILNSGMSKLSKGVKKSMNML